MCIPFICLYLILDLTYKNSNDITAVKSQKEKLKKKKNEGACMS